MKKNYGIILASLTILVSSCVSNENKSHQNKQSTESNSMETIKVNETKKQEINISYNLNLKDFIPKNYALLDSASGNLNLDNYKDYVLVLKKIDEEKTSDVIDHPEKRPLLLLVGQEDGSFKLVKKNSNSIYCVDCGGVMGDPYSDITIEKGKFTVFHFGGSAWKWTKDITYTYSKPEMDWLVTEVKSTSFNSNDMEEKIEETVLTKKDFGKVKFEKYDIYKED